MKVNMERIETFLNKNEDIIIDIMEVIFKMIGYSVVTITVIGVVFFMVSMILIFNTYPIA